jgi:NAD(P)H-nitrite reductase large subunit
MPQVPGTDLEGIYGCRSYNDFKQIQALLKPGVHAVVIGGGVLGLEVAAAMIKAQAHVTVLEFSGRLLPKQLSSSASVVLENTIKNNAAGSIDILCGVSAASIEGKEGGVEAVNLADGRRIPCDIVIAAMGVIPETGLAGKAGLQISNRGIVIDTGCRCVGQKDVFACGDCAVVDGFNPGLFPVAQQQGQTAGSNMTGGDAVFTAVSVPVRLPAFGVKMLSIGEINESDAVEKVSEESASVLRGLYFRDGKCCGAIMLGDLTRQNNIAAIVNTGMDRETALKEGGLI